MTQALRQLVEDFLSAILFFAIYALSGSLYMAVGVAIAAGLAQLLLRTAAGRRVEPMQWISFALVIVLAGATILTQSPRLMMIKPTIVHLAIATVMLQRGWMARYLPQRVREHVPDGTIVAAGYAWALLLAALGVANLAVALDFDMATWAWFVSVGAVGAKVAAFTAQYLFFRTIIRRRLRDAAALPAAG